MTRRKNNILVITVCILAVCFIILMNYNNLPSGVKVPILFILVILLVVLSRNIKAKKTTNQLISINEEQRRDVIHIINLRRTEATNQLEQCRLVMLKTGRSLDREINILLDRLNRLNVIEQEVKSKKAI